VIIIEIIIYIILACSFLYGFYLIAEMAKEQAHINREFIRREERMER